MLSLSLSLSLIIMSGNTIKYGHFIWWTIQLHILLVFISHYIYNKWKVTGQTEGNIKSMTMALMLMVQNLDTYGSLIIKFPWLTLEVDSYFLSGLEVRAKIHLICFNTPDQRACLTIEWVLRQTTIKWGRGRKLIKQAD